MAPFIAHISGNPNVPTFGSINVRAAPSTATGVAVLFQGRVGLTSLSILDVKPDQQNNAYNRKVYQWFQLRFPDNRTGWVRDDLISIEGDGAAFGYPNLTQAAYAFGVLRALLPTTPAPTPPTPNPPTPEPPVPNVDIYGTVISLTSLNLRETPVNGTIKARIGYKKRVKVLATTPQGGTSNYTWAQVQAVEGVGWVRTDYLSIAGDASRFGLSKGDEFPAPMANYWWNRGQNVNNNPGEALHKGWDFGANPGEAIRCAPSGGMVIRMMTCTRCTADKPNVGSQGISFDNPTVLNDPAWGFGYGNAVIMRYLNDQLPTSTRERLASSGMSGAHLFVIYAHLSAVNVQVGQTLAGSQQVGVIGNTGNSTATHLHIEVHASFNPVDTNWGAMRNFDPGIAFLR